MRAGGVDGAINEALATASRSICQAALSQQAKQLGISGTQIYMVTRPIHKTTTAERRHSGITLVELLTVTAIIGTLVGLLFPSLQSAREGARRAQCAKNVKELGLAALSHEATQRFFPTGGWNSRWLGHPERGFGPSQPGGWIYNLLPFLDQQNLYDLGACQTDAVIEDANATRVTTPLSGLNCPSRRTLGPYTNGLPTPFYLTSDFIFQVARSDYAMNGGDYKLTHSTAFPTSLSDGDNPSTWSRVNSTALMCQNGISYQRSQVTTVDIWDGTSNTFLIGEKYVNRKHYLDGVDWGDKGAMYSGGDVELLRWTGINGKVSSGTGTSYRDSRPRQDSPTPGEGSKMQWFGSAHPGAFNMSFCDGSVRSIEYTIDAEVYRCLGNRKDCRPIRNGQF